jgi:gliding motility-associated-like protein
LVTKILVNKTCVPVSNITWKTGNTNGFGSSNGIGYFTNSNPNFPLTSGVVLSTGNVANAAGPNTNQLDDGNDAWSGDTDLESTLLAAGITMNSKNATVLEFDFVPFSSNFDFNFLFASEEYGNFQCQFSDAFAFLLTNKSTGVTTNLAVVPNTSIPISVVTIRNSLYNSSCSSQNSSYFGRFNGGSNAADSATNFNGQTVTLSASSTTLIPNTTYHIKLVIADRGDSKADSGIFLGANSFNVGQDVLGPDLTIASKAAICNQGTHKLTSGLNPAIYSFAWTYNGNSIGGNTPNLTVTQPGVYGLTYSISATSCAVTTDFINVEYFPVITTPDPFDLYKCDLGLPNYTFDLSTNTPIVSIANTQISYHSSLPNAISNSSPLPVSVTFQTPLLPATIWVRIENTDTKCIITKSFQLQIIAPPTATIPSNMSLCETPLVGINTALFNIDSQTATIMGGQSMSIYEIFYYDKASDATAGINAINPAVPYRSGNATLYARVQNSTDSTCFSTTSFKLTVIPKPVLDEKTSQYVCVSYTLPPLVNPGNYYSGPNQGLPMLNAGDVISTDLSIYLYSTSAGTPSCSNESNFEVKIITPLDVNPTDVVICDQFTFPSTPFGLRYFSLQGGPNGGGIEYPVGSAITAIGITTIYTYFSAIDTINPCIFEGKFNVTIYKTPIISPIANVFDCNSYNLPPLAVGVYYTYDTATGIYTPAISPITTTTTLYVFARNNICRSPDRIFTVYIGSLGLIDKNECQSYILPPAPVGEYRDAPNGGGNLIVPGLIEKTTTIYTNIVGATCVTDSFTITINAPFLTTPTARTECESYTLPTQVDGGVYYSRAGGPSTPNNVQLFPNSTTITNTRTIFIYKPSTTLLGCYNEKPWTITILKKPLIDSRDKVDQCNSYTLTPLNIGAYYDDPNGLNPLPSGTVINTDNRIYIYAADPNDPSCYSENFFDIFINGVQADPIPSQLSYCESFTFPALPTPNNFYYDAPGGPLGGGNRIAAGTTVTATTVLPMYYIYYETGDRLNCSDENPFRITITPRPVANPVTDSITCDTFANNDGFFEFNLTSLSIRNQVLNGQVPDANFTLTFYTSLAQANDLREIPIQNPAKYINDTPFADSVWIRVSNNSSAVACFDVVEVKLTVNLTPEARLLPEYFICEDYKPGALLNPATLNSGISGSNYLFEWTFNGVPFADNSASITTAQVGDYTLKATNITTLCATTVSAKVITYAPYLELVYSDAFENTTFITVNVLGVGSGNYEYQLDNLPFQDNNIFTTVLPGEHTISVNDKNGHCNPSPLKTTIINFPKFFTPNGDGFNETWNIVHLANSNPNAAILIFDRYGKVLKQISPLGEGWNGTFNGQPLPSNDYWFTVDYDEKGNSKVFKSHFTLKR